MKQMLLIFLLVFLGFATTGQDLRVVANTIREAHQIPSSGYAVDTPDSILEHHVMG